MVGTKEVGGRGKEDTMVIISLLIELSSMGEIELSSL
jgi:hypothetical protein